MNGWQKFILGMENALERTIFASRWLLAPIYLGLALSVAVLLVKFGAELLHVVTHATTASETDVILGVLALVDLALTASLLIIVIFSGYENFVSKIDHSSHKDWPDWMGTIDFTGLKLKLLSSIVAISAVQLLKQFMSIHTVTDRDVLWLVIIHVVFVVSSVLLALSDRIAGDGHSHQELPQEAPQGGSNRGQSAASPVPPSKGKPTSRAQEEMETAIPSKKAANGRAGPAT